MAKAKILLSQNPDADFPSLICEHAAPQTPEWEGQLIVCSSCMDAIHDGATVIDQETGKVVMRTPCDGLRYKVGASSFNKVKLSPIEKANWTKVEYVCLRVLTVIKGLPEESRAGWVQMGNMLLCGDCAKQEAEVESAHAKFLEWECQQNTMK
jgi:hypothetical protein